MKILMSIFLMGLITFGAMSQSIHTNANLRIKTMVSFGDQSRDGYLFTEFRSFSNFNSLLWNDPELSSWNVNQYNYQYNSAFFIPEIRFSLMKDFTNDFEIGFGWNYLIYNKDIFSPTTTDVNRLTKRIKLRMTLF